MTLQICVLIGLLFVPQAASQDIPEVISVSLGHPLTLSCGGSSRRDVLWYFKQHEHDDWHVLAKFQDGAFSTGSVFQGRVEKPENYNITISSVVYNDRGIYECRHEDGTVFSDVKVDILSPSDVSIANGMSASLPCYGNIDKGGRTVDLDILWKKGEKKVCHLHNDTITYGDGFENRASLSTKLALQGNLSLTIRETRFSDQGEYQCFYNRRKQKGNPDSASLVVTGYPPQNLTVKPGDVFSIPLYTTDPVRVTFTSENLGLHDVLMYANKGPARYGERCSQRCEVLAQNKTLLLSDVTQEDAGVYKVTDSETNETIGTVSLQVPDSRLSTGAVVGIVVAVLALAVAVGFAVYRKNREPGSVPYRGAQVVDQNGSDSRAFRASLLPDDLEPQLSVSETQPPHTRPLLPVSENEPSPPEPRLPVSETQPDLTKIQAKSAEEL